MSDEILTDAEMLRYSRQISIKAMDIEARRSSNRPKC